MRILASALISALFALPAGAQTTFTTIDNSADATFNQLLGINDGGVIVGYYGSGVEGHPNQGYSVASPYSSFTAVTYTGAVQSQATGINNNGDIVGYFATTNTGTDANTGFFLPNCVKKNNKPCKLTNQSFADVNAGGTPLITQLEGLNNKNIAVGYYNDANGKSHGLIYAVDKKTAKTVDIQHEVGTNLTGINIAATISGAVTDSKSLTRGFLRSKGDTVLYRYAGSKNTQFLGVNDSDVAVGFYVDANSVTHGLIYNLKDKKAAVIDAPAGVKGTTLNGINNKGQAVGFYVDANGNNHGLLVNGITAP